MITVIRGCFTQRICFNAHLQFLLIKRHVGGTRLLCCRQWSLKSCEAPLQEVEEETVLRATEPTVDVDSTQPS